MAKKDKSDRFKLEIPLDASEVEDFKPEQAVKVALQMRGDEMRVETVQLDEGGRGTATFTFDKHPGPLHVIVGPESAADEELPAIQTITMDVSSGQWQQKQELTLAPVRISAYYWYWWLRWCREFVIRGRVVCPDGNPVPGAEVCAYDVDWWFLWTSTQQVGCATTDINGAFELRFRWCCGWWPWWWWRYRVWQLDPGLAQRIQPVLRRDPDLRLSSLTSNQPNLSMFKELLADEGLRANEPLARIDPGALEQVRKRLLERLPKAPELEALHIWPWWPWWPWWDCTPDIIFKVTQDCLAPGTVIVDEGFGDTRWNIPTALEVTLVANEEACCRQRCQDPPCEDGECLVVTRVCGEAINDIGGNLGAMATPEGYLFPGNVTPGTDGWNADRPFAGIVAVEKNTGDMLNVDYYEIEVNDGSGWSPLPAGAAVDFKRRWMELVAGFPTGDVPFNWVTISGHEVVESREHYEANGPFSDWWNPVSGGDRIWLVNEFLVVPLNSTAFTDGTYRFRIVGWEIDGGGNLINRRVLPICATEQENELVLTFDNIVIDPVGHAVSHNCGGVHTCTLEPDTHIMAVRVNGVALDPCATIDTREGTLEVDFLAHDPDGHLGGYWLNAHWGLNDSHSLLNRPGASVTPLVPGTPTGWKAGLNRGTYGVALDPVDPMQGATAPTWNGGTYRLTVPVSEAFPDPCCYQLRLRAWKRTVVGGQSGILFKCTGNHDNHTEYTIGIGV